VWHFLLHVTFHYIFLYLPLLVIFWNAYSVLMCHSVISYSLTWQWQILIPTSDVRSIWYFSSSMATTTARCSPVRLVLTAHSSRRLTTASSTTVVCYKTQQQQPYLTFCPTKSIISQHFHVYWPHYHGNAIASVCPSVCLFLSNFRTEWPLTLIFFMCVGDYSGSHGIEKGGLTS